MKSRQIILIAMLFVCICFTLADAADITKGTLPGTADKVSGRLPENADNIQEMFVKGAFYGRLRINSFLWDWDREMAGDTKDHWSIGAGGSVIYKSATFQGVTLIGGLYTAHNPWHMSRDDIRYAKAGKDMFSRCSVAAGNGWDMAVLAQAYLDYRFLDSNIRVGHQLFESLLTSANDTKMIPNAFRGVSFESGNIDDIRIKAAWFTGQKLRDHTSFHHVLAYGEDPENSNAAWTQNDDSAMHRGLTLSKLREAGIQDRLMIFQAENMPTEYLDLMVNYTDVPKLVGSVTGEINSIFTVGGGITLTSGIRYLSQFDHGGGRIGGASLKGAASEVDSRGYRDPSSLAGSMFAVKFSAGKNAGSLLIGYSKIADEADLVTPWRGFPTGGYTRAMGQYNWYANTESRMLQVDYDFEKAGLIPGFSVKVRYVIQDYDDLKADVPADNSVLNVDFLKNVVSCPGLELKIRANFVESDAHTKDMNGRMKPDLSYDEYRFEVNFLF